MLNWEEDYYWYSDTRLLDYKTCDLLRKFGAGDHKPGSGSAAAFEGLLAAQLNHTVISLTLERKRKAAYGEVWSEFKNLDKQILEKTYPRLEQLFQEDSILFDKVIKARKARDLEAKNPFKWQILEEKHLQLLVPATEILIEIAKLCRDLVEISVKLFDRGFQAARGDTIVALNGALSSLSGCLSIVDLNLLSFRSNEWTEKIRNARAQMYTEYEGLSTLGAERQSILEEESLKFAEVINEFRTVTHKIPSEEQVTDVLIEEIAIDLQSLIWKNREILWKKNTPDDPIKTLKPSLLFKKFLGYRFHTTKSLSNYKTEEDNFEVAGIIDQNQRVVSISENFSPAQQNFTAAHELGHALFHKHAVLHRDRPIDDSAPRQPRTKTERQADKFAAFFLMPARDVQEVFEELFATGKFEINDDTAFSLSGVKPSELRKMCKDVDGLAYRIASTERYGANKIPSLASLFSVTPGAMAIRLLELGLVRF